MTDSPIGDAEGRLRDYAMQLQYPNDAAGAARIVYGPDRSVDGRRVLNSGHEAAHALYLDISALFARLETAERENKRLEKVVELHRERIVLEAKMVRECDDKIYALMNERDRLTALIRDTAIPALAMDTFEQVFNQQRFAEDTDTDYFLRCFRALRDRASQAHAKLSAEVGG